MACVSDQFLKVDFGVSERRPGLTATQLHSVQQFIFGIDHPHAASATAPGCFQHQRITDLGRNPLDLIGILGQGIGRGQDLNIRFTRLIARGDLVAETSHDVWRRTDEP